MMLLRRTTFHTNNSIEETFARLYSRVEKVQTLLNPFLNATIATTRLWVGKLDKENNKFEIIQTSPFFSPRLQKGNFFRIFVRGELVKMANEAK